MTDHHVDKRLGTLVYADSHGKTQNSKRDCKLNSLDIFLNKVIIINIIYKYIKSLIYSVASLILVITSVSKARESAHAAMTKTPARSYNFSMQDTTQFRVDFYLIALRFLAIILYDS